MIAYRFMGEGLKRKKNGFFFFFLLEPFPYTIPRSVIARPMRGKASNLFHSKRDLHALPALPVEAKRRSRHRGPVAPSDGTGVVKISHFVFARPP
jgi:hypothetical protein